MASFRYLGAVVVGEVDDGLGMVLPNIVREIQLYGFEFNNKTYTEVPDNAVAQTARVLDRGLGRLVEKTIYVVDKLRGNNHFEENSK